MLDLAWLERLTSLSGIAAHEQEVALALQEWYDNHQIEHQSDGLGSVLASLAGQGKRIMLASHMDEVGFLIESVNQSYASLRPVGSWWTHLLLGQWFTVTTQDGQKIAALMGSPATHGIDSKQKEKVQAIEDCYLDFGSQAPVSPGDMVVPEANFRLMYNKDIVASKALDDRIGCFILTEVAQRLKNDVHAHVILAHTAQEEVGLRGARTATYLARADLGIAIDTTLAGDTPANQNGCRLGGGVVLSMIDSNSIAPRWLANMMAEIAKQHHIPYQYAVFNGGGTDCGNMHKMLDGMPAMTLSIPIRYMHTNSALVHLKDVQACVDLLVCFLKEEGLCTD